MVARRTRSRGASVWLGVVSLALIAIPGFALGLAAGVAWQDPGLLATHLFGRTQEVAVRVPRPAAPPAPERPARRLPAVAAAPAAPEPAAPRPPVHPPPAAAAGRFAVQVGAFSQNAAAERLAGTLRAKGFPVYVSPGAKAGEARWRVRVGPLPSREEAERTAGRLKRAEKLPTWVLDEDGAV